MRCRPAPDSRRVDVAKHADMLAAILPPDALCMDGDALTKRWHADVVHKRIALVGTIIEAVLSGETAICIHDVRQHINDQPETEHELLFQVSEGTFGSMLLVPMLRGSTVCGALYLTSRVQHAMGYKQLDAEVLMMIISERVAEVMHTRGAHRLAPPRARPLAGLVEAPRCRGA